MNVKNEIEKIDLVEYLENFTELTKQGSQYRGVCPICNHGNPQEFVIYNHRSFHCWVCGKSGDIINFVRAKFNLDFFAAVEKLADELNIDFNRDERYIARKKIANQCQLFATNSMKNVNRVYDYLKSRNLSDDTIKKFELGANPFGNVTIPFIDENGRYIGCSVRQLNDSPKYLNSKNNELFTKAEFLFNLRNAKNLLTNELFLVEGFFDAMSLDQNQFPAVAYNGSQLTKQQLSKLAELHSSFPNVTMILVPDNDGIAYPLLTKTRKHILKYAPDVPFEVLLLPDGIKDTSDFFLSNSKDDFLKLPRKSLDLFVLEFELKNCSSIDAEKKIVEKFSKSISDNLKLIDIAKFLAKRWKIDKNSVCEFLKISQSDAHLIDDFKDPYQCTLEAQAMLLESNMKYGFDILDNNINGIGRKRDVTFVGAASGVGKTYLTLQICLNMVCFQKKNAIFFSMEMSAGALYERIIANLLKKTSFEVDRLILAGDPAVEKILDDLKDHLFVVDKNALSVDQLNAYVKEANVKIFDGELDVIFIDYIQYMKGCSEYATLAETAKAMKPLAKENNIHVVVLSQLNRGMNSYQRPSVAGLKGGGDLEASADNIFLLWRPGFNPALSPPERDEMKNIIMLGVGKARSGAKVDEISLVFDPRSSSINVKL